GGRRGGDAPGGAEEGVVVVDGVADGVEEPRALVVDVVVAGAGAEVGVLRVHGLAGDDGPAVPDEAALREEVAAVGVRPTEALGVEGLDVDRGALVDPEVAPVGDGDEAAPPLVRELVEGEPGEPEVLVSSPAAI